MTQEDESRPGWLPETASALLTLNGTAVCCPSCRGNRSEYGFNHRAECRVWVAIKAALNDDAAWFRAHQGLRKRVRPVTQAEADDVQMAWGWRPVGPVIVVEWQYRVRTRMFSDGERVMGGHP